MSQHKVGGYSGSESAERPKPPTTPGAASGDRGMSDDVETVYAALTHGTFRCTNDGCTEATCKGKAAFGAFDRLAARLEATEAALRRVDEHTKAFPARALDPKCVEMVTDALAALNRQI